LLSEDSYLLEVQTKQKAP